MKNKYRVVEYIVSVYIDTPESGIVKVTNYERRVKYKKTAMRLVNRILDEYKNSNVPVFIFLEKKLEPKKEVPDYRGEITLVKFKEVLLYEL